MLCNVSTTMNSTVTSAFCNNNVDSDLTSYKNDSSQEQTVRSSVTCSSGSAFYIIPLVNSKEMLFTGTGLSVMVTILNGILVTILLRKNNISPVNILLAVLGISDAICSLFMFQPIFIGYITDMIPFGRGKLIGDMPGYAVFVISFPYCIAIDWIHIILNSCIHTISISLTTVLGLVKALVLMFPLKSRVYVTNRLAWYICIVVTVFSFAFHAPWGFMKSFTKIGHDKCCVDLSFIKYLSTILWFVVIVYIVSFSVLILSTIYIWLKLTIWRTKIQRSENPRHTERNRRTAIIVASIIVIFLICELPNATCIVLNSITGSNDLCSKNIDQYQNIIILTGFASNFFIYWLMSNNLRSQFYSYMKSCCCFAQFSKGTRTVTSMERAKPNQFGSKSVEATSISSGNISSSFDAGLSS